MLSVRIDELDGKYYVYQTMPNGTTQKISKTGYVYMRSAKAELERLQAERNK